MKWYYTNKSQTEMCCSECVLDDQFSIICTTQYVSELPQTVVCRFCKWCPKKDGLSRPNDKTSGYQSQISLLRCY